MDAFWGPIVVYSAVAIGGAIVAGIGAGIDESNPRSEGGKMLAMFGGAAFMLGVGGIGVFLVGSLIEHIG